MAPIHDVETDVLLTDDGFDGELEVEPQRCRVASRSRLILLLTSGALVLVLVGAIGFARSSRFEHLTPTASRKIISKFVTPSISNPYSGVAGAPIGTVPGVPAVALPKPAAVAAAFPAALVGGSGSVAPAAGVAPGALPVAAAAAAAVPAVAAAAPAVAAAVPAVAVVCPTSGCPINPETPAANPLNRPEDMSDGNQCRDDEEELGGLCYRKCSLFPGFTCSAKRISAFECCGRAGVNENCDDPLEFTNVADMDIELDCEGFAISSANGKEDCQYACPHKPGACLEDEEQDMGLCFQKCSILTGGMYPYRCGPDTCATLAAEADVTQCVLDSQTDIKFAVGGGAGDHDPSTPSAAHYPSTKETEATPPPPVTTAKPPAAAISAAATPPAAAAPPAR